MIVRPITRDVANAFIEAHHRHAKRVAGHRFALAGLAGDVMFGVVIVARPIARKLQDADGLVAEIVRLCVCTAAPRNGCSFLYGAARRAWLVMGGSRLITYTLQSESGASLRGAGFHEEARYQPTGNHAGGWGSRGREYRPIYDEPKIRWGAE